MVKWTNYDELAYAKELAALKEQVEVKSVMAGDNGAKRVKEYQVPMSSNLVYNYASKQVDDKVIAF